MDSPDRRPLTECPTAERIKRVANNRLGAVCSALYSFWSARHAAAATEQRTLGTQHRHDKVYSSLHYLNLWFASATRGQATRGQEPVSPIRDSYSVILFNDRATTALLNDVTSSPDQLLDTMLLEPANGGTSFTRALRKAEDVMVQNWSMERFVA